MSGDRSAVVAARLFDGDLMRGPAALLLEQGRIAAIGAPGDVPGGMPVHRLPDEALLAPGLIDVQVNGGGGVLLNDDPSPAAMAAIARAHRRFGTTGLLPTLISDTRDVMAAAVRAGRAGVAHPGVLGVHIEGPFFNPARKGVHRADMIRRPEPEDLEILSDLAGLPAGVVTLAPEMAPPGFVAGLAARGIRVSAGHSEASAADMAAAIGDGLTGVTHLFNAMAPMTARVPGLAGTALTDPRLFVGIIGDAVTVVPTMLDLAVRAIGPQRLMLVTDAMPSVGSGSDRFVLMGREIVLRDGVLVAPDGTLAGAHLGLIEAVRHAVNHTGASLRDALAMASRTPAAFLGLGASHGRIAKGYAADLIALDARLEVLGTWIGGAWEAA
jgi:N-acetylglucosamine-6-phosphate deacetylase